MHFTVPVVVERKSRVFSVESGLRAMSRLYENERICAIGIIQAGVLHCAVATQFCVHITTI